MMNEEVPDLEVDFGRTPGGLNVSISMPYRILVVSDLAGPSGSISAQLSDGPVEVTAENLDALLASARLSVRFTTADPTKPGNAMAEIALSFDNMKSFKPAEIAANFSGTQAFMSLREQLVGRLRGKVSRAQLDGAVDSALKRDADLSWLKDALQAKAALPAAAPEAVDSLLDQLDLGDGSQPSGAAPRSPIAGAVAAAASGGAALSPEEASAVRRALGELDRRIATWLNAILHAPAVQSVETAWRSLAFLVSNIDFRRGVRLSVLHAPRRDVCTRLVSHVIDPVFDAGADAPDVIIADYAWDSTAGDLEILDELAQHSASLPTVTVTGAGPGFFGVKQAWQIPTLPPLISMFDQWQFAKWKTLRNQPYSRNLSVFFGRGLLRVPHGREDAADLELAYREEAVAEKDFCWCNAPMAVALTIARSVAEQGWPTAVAGYANGRVGGFATAHGGPKGDKPYGPADTATPMSKVEEMAAAGLNAVVSVKDLDDVIVCNGLTAARARQISAEGLLEVSLPYQLFAGRLSTLLLSLQPSLAGKSEEAATQHVETHVKDWLKTEGQADIGQVVVQVRPAETDPTKLQLAVTVTPPSHILPGGIPVVMGYVFSR